MRDIRWSVPEDAPALAELFFAAVRQGALGAYTETQCRAWCPEVPAGAAWSRKLADAEVAVAERDGEILGFMSLIVGRSYLDMAFVHPDHLRQGVASALYSVIEGRARALGLVRLDTEASLLAEPLFAAQGWRVTRRQEVVRRGVTLKNAWMEKPLMRPGAT